MSTVINWLKNEPALVAAVVGIITTLAASIPTGQGVLGAVVSAVQAVLAAIVRSQVTPTAAAPKAPA